LDSVAVRARMVERLRAQGVRSEPVLLAMQQVPRHQFVDAALAHRAYLDTSLPIGFGQTISKPSVVAQMIALLLSGANAARTRSLGRTLEIGSGCGYQAAVLCHLATQVVSIERLRALFERARENLRDLRTDRLRLVHGDGALGHPPNAPYDSIIASASGEDVPAAWLDQLAIGGRLVAPVNLARGPAQSLVVIDRRAEGLIRNEHGAVIFVPLKSGVD
jgi:protein-L-isoaspartate(D-aspartate) O-methyltransferase